MRIDHVIHRIHVQRLLLAAALLGLSLSANAAFIARTTHGNFQVVGTGKSVQLLPPQTALGAGNAVASTGTVNAIPAAGVATQGMGATAAGSTAASGINLTGNAKVGVNGSTVPVQVKTNLGTDVLIPAAIAAATCAKGGVVGGIVCAAGVVVAPLALQWLASAGGRINDETKQLERMQGAGTIYGVAGTTCQGTDGAAVARCAAIQLTGNTPTTPCYLVTAPNWRCEGVWAGALANIGTSPGSYLPSSMDDIAPYMRDKAVDPGIVNEVTNAGVDLGNPPLQVTGPASVQGPTTTSVTNNSTTNTTTNTTTTTNNYTYNNNTINNISSSSVTTTTTAVKNPDGTTTTTTGPTTTTTTDPGETEPVKPEEQPTQCDKFPNSLGCAELDTPTGEIPRETKTITFEAEDVLGGGQCPADVMTTLSTLDGRSVKIIDWATFCGMALPLRALVMALASIMAFFIIMPGGVRE